MTLPNNIATKDGGMLMVTQLIYCMLTFFYRSCIFQV